MQQGTRVLFVQFPYNLWPLLHSAFEVSVMLRILQRCSFDGNGICFETRETMATVCGLSPKQWTKVIKDLEERGLIKVVRAHRAPCQITLTDRVKDVLEGKNDLLKIKDNIYSGTNLPSKRKSKQKQIIKYNEVTEVERIHAKWLKKQDKGT
jgi:predicted transcriptional regulator